MRSDEIDITTTHVDLIAMRTLSFFSIVNKTKQNKTKQNKADKQANK